MYVKIAKQLHICLYEICGLDIYIYPYTHIQICTHTHTHMYVCIYMYICIHLYNVNTYISFDLSCTVSPQRAKQLLPIDWSYIKLLNFVQLSSLLIKKGSHKRYATFTTLAVVWAFWSFKIFFWSELCCVLMDIKIAVDIKIAWINPWFTVDNMQE